MSMQSTAQPVPNEPVLFVPDKKILIVADLHIGIETELRELGLHTASQTVVLIQRLLNLFKRYRPKEIVLLGDVKHTIPSSTIQERKDVRRFFETIQVYGTVHIVPGNHDGNIKKLVPPGMIVHPSDGVVLDTIGLVHGHRWPHSRLMRCKQLIIGHTHPTVMLTDRLGYKTFEPCWLRSTFIRSKLQHRYPDSTNPPLIVMPAFNPLCGGIAANKEPLVGPLGKIMDVGHAQVYLLDGSSLGVVKDI
jgi:hypothetical protein